MLRRTHVEMPSLTYRSSAVPPRPKVFLIPHDRNPHFLGRGELLKALRQKLLETDQKRYIHRIALYGMGGVGKTQIAIGYVYEYRNDYDDVYWISGSDQAMLLSGFREIGEMTGCLAPAGKEGLKPAELAHIVLSWLRLQENWLLVIDNLDDVSVVDGFLPTMDGGGHTLITTRNPDAKAIPAEGCQILVLDEVDAVELLCVRSENIENVRFSTIAVDVVNELGYLPLAIDHAAALIRSLSLDITDFLSLFHESRKEILSRDPTNKNTYPNSVAATSSCHSTRLQQFPNMANKPRSF